MSSIVAKKKSKPVGFTRKEMNEMRDFDTTTRMENELFNQVFHILIVATFYILRWKYGYGRKRLDRFKADVAYMEEECKADRMDMVKFVRAVDAKCGISGEDLLKQIPVSQIQYLTGWARKTNSMRRIAIFRKALLWWYAISLWTLKKAFGFSQNELKRLVAYEVDLIDTLCRVKQFGITTALLRETLQEETGFSL